ncbi:squalene/phytoene synthase [Candidatus Nitromaritima sp. SCGC AAA799-A02]|nr:squalene/phytoene synthase [Candidatus Nitromaritima sp. SCGC AAA799-A02]KMP11748.1 squalene/phytoene synthase [Candidatus Nitromaritima sp. SCGC AAA799-C22]
MDDWNYCITTLPKVSRTFALNISVLKGELHRSILIAYLFCRTVDTVEDAGELDAPTKIKLLLDFAALMKNSTNRNQDLDRWLKDIAVVDGSESDLDLLRNIRRVFNSFDSLEENHKQQIIPSVCTMAQGMAYFQKKFDSEQITLLENAEELEEYCYFVAGAVGEMLRNLFFQALPGLPSPNRETMRRTAVSFGLGLQITNISKDIVVDRGRGWSYVPKSYMAENGLTAEEFHAGASTEKDLKVLECLLNKTVGHLNDALDFTLAIPRRNMRLRLFCIWPLWMAMETVAVLHDNHDLLKSDANVKISRQTVRRILRRTPFICWSNGLLNRSFENILQRDAFQNPARFNLDGLKRRLSDLALDDIPQKTQVA